MTTVVAAAVDGKVFMAADSCLTLYNRPVVGLGMKILRLDAGDDEVLLGLSGHWGLSGFLSKLKLPVAPDESESYQAWAHELAGVITKAAVEAGIVDDGQMDNHLLLGWNGLLWTLHHHTALAHLDGRAAIGSGEAVALGALDAFLATDVPTAAAVAGAADIACRRDIYSQGPVQVEVLDAPEEAA
ncbi:hypothetical protein [Micromonospora sp. NPDC047730]|uniref:hypothetical protein n=1 Tax=Micromonospora sp. NPDC047730 TaxID=3364253 RepID=UPI00371F10FF